MAHAAVGQIPHKCIINAFGDNKEIMEWSKHFFEVCKGNLKFVNGDLYHLWHGDVEKRQYLNRIKEFAPISEKIVQKDKNGLYVGNKNSQQYVTHYMKNREPIHDVDDGFTRSMMMGYMTDNELLGYMYGGNRFGAHLGASMRHSSKHHQEVDKPRDYSTGEPLNYLNDKVENVEGGTLTSNEQTGDYGFSSNTDFEATSANDNFS